jgi:hypothetical protein
MPVRLLNADKDIIALAGKVLGFTDRELDRFALIVAMSDRPAIMVDHVPSVACFIKVDMKSGICASRACRLCHQCPPNALATFLRLLPNFFTASRTADGLLPAFFAS